MGEPMDDQAAFRQLGQANHRAVSRFHVGKDHPVGGLGIDHKKIDRRLRRWPNLRRDMAEQSIADLLALDTDSLQGRLSDLRRYL